MRKKELPLIVVKVDIEQKTFDPDAIDTEVYCVNTSSDDLLISLRNESFITVDEESGDAAHADSDLIAFDMKPDTCKLIARIAGWEWDGHVGIELGFRTGESQEPTFVTYDFKSGKGEFFIRQIQLNGRIIPPRLARK